jgi:hypothetical protein
MKTRNGVGVTVAVAVTVAVDDGVADGIAVDVALGRGVKVGVNVGGRFPLTATTATTPSPFSAPPILPSGPLVIPSPATVMAAAAMAIRIWQVASADPDLTQAGRVRWPAAALWSIPDVTANVATLSITMAVGTTQRFVRIVSRRDRETVRGMVLKRGCAG